MAAVWAASIAFPSIVIPNARGDSITINPSADTSLFEGAPFNNMGAVQSLAVGVTGNESLARALVRFDLSALPTGARVTSAVLTLPVVRTSFFVDPATFNLHRVSANWIEGSQGAGTVTGSGSMAADGEPCWIARMFPDEFWDNAGGAAGSDYVEAASASVSVSGNTPFVFSGAGLVGDVQSWLEDPASNQGWLIKDQNESSLQTGRRLGSREHSSSKPRLQIEYTAPLRISEVRLEQSQFCLTFNAQAGQGYVVESRPAVHSGQWATVANVPPPANSGPLKVCDPLNPGSRFYRVVEQ